MEINGEELEISPLPWRFETDAEGDHRNIDATGKVILAKMSYEDEPPIKDDMKFIAHTCTAYPHLVAALKDMVDMMDSGEEPGAGSEWHRNAKAALAVAGVAP